MTFDEAAYKEYLKALSKELESVSRAVNEIRGGASYPTGIDLFAIYRATPGIGASELRAAVGGVRNSWKLFGNTPIKNLKTLSQLLPTLDLVLSSPSGDRKLTPDQTAFWTEYQTLIAGHRSDTVKRLTDHLRAEIDLSVTTIGSARALSKALDITDDAIIREAVKGAGKIVVEPPALPDESELGGVAGLITAMNASAKRSVFELVHPGFDGEFQVIGTVIGPNGLAINADAIQRAIVETEKRADAENDAARKALASLKKILEKATPEQVALYLLAKSAESRMASPKAAADYLIALQVRRSDAECIVLALAERGGGSATRLTPKVVAASLANRKLGAAKQQLEALPADTPGLAELRQKIQRQLDEVAQLEEKARAAIARGDTDEAVRSFASILQIDIDRDDVAEALRKQPPMMPVGLSLNVSEVDRATPAVGLTWSDPVGQQGETSFRIVRAVGEVAAKDGSEGHVLAETDRRQYADEEPPIAVRLHYLVFAQRDGQSSKPAVASEMVLPAPRNPRVHAGETSARLTWDVTSDKVSKVIVRIIGPDLDREVRAEITGADIRGLRTGVRYEARIWAEYLEGRSCSREVRIDFVPSSPPKPVPSLSIDVSADCQVTATWKASPHPVIIRAGTAAPGWGYGVEVPAAEAAKLELVLPAAGNSAVQSKAIGPMPAGIHHFVPLTATGNGTFLVGQLVRKAIAPAVRNLRAERRGSQAVLLWDWPEGVHEVDVSWSGQSRPFTRESVRLNGGAVIDTGPRPCEVHVAGVVGRGGQRESSTAARITVPGVTASVRYEIKWPNPVSLRTRGGTAQVTFMSDDEVSARVLIVGRASDSMPTKPSSGAVLVDCDAVLAPGRGQVVDVPLEKIRGRFWLRCFAAEQGSILMKDPDIDNLRRG